MSTSAGASSTGPRRGLGHVSVVVLCHDRVDEVERNIPPRIDDVRSHGLELVVVDNASTDGTRASLETLHQGAQDFALVLNETNRGVAAGRNAGWLRTTRPFIITLDEDATVTTSQLLALVEALDSDERLGIVHPIPVDPATRRPQIRPLEPPHRATNFHGCCYAIRREVIEAVGMHDDLCDFGGEELDLSIRTRAAGWEVRQVPSIVILHNALRRVGPIARWRRERWTQNHARVLWHWFPYRHALPWSLLMLLGEARASFRRGATEDVGGLLRAWWAGVREGLARHSPVPSDVTEFYATRLGVAAVVRRLRLDANGRRG